MPATNILTGASPQNKLIYHLIHQTTTSFHNAPTIYTPQNTLMNTITTLNNHIIDIKQATSPKGNHRLDDITKQKQTQK